MDWTRTVDAYCERLTPALWAEPVNALTNLAFVVAAVVVWRRLNGADTGLARVLAVVLALIGLGSFLFHTVARAWAGLADVVPIAAFVTLYLYAANRAFWGLGPARAALGTVLALAVCAAAVPLLAGLPVVGVSAGYLPLPLLIAGYAVALARRAPATARGLAVGAALLAVSILLRSLDAPLCAIVPLGTHFGWHLLNAAMLGWMIEVYRVHVVAQPSRGR
ncbi:ceramidase domain-containing protein [Roseovarius salinarum]|uniref:ceramidase domain-containing protein n=1 Tax=Roseovarius salinarum TaxID=1981892 RepID=UPI000C33A7CD|nr:ceramidase domain-containing protein [Roseovarius salinarum]